MPVYPAPMQPDPPAERIAPPAWLRQGAVAAVLAALPGARAVGGAVRDTLAGRPVQDVDVAVPLPPESVAPRLREAGLKVFETGLAHGTLTAVKEGVPVEVTSLRRDVLTDGRHATVEWTTDWREDAARRDFTINAMSLDAEGALWDYFGGRADLAAGRVRFVGEAARRIAEDYLRALRFFRFQARYGRGEPDAEAIAAIRAAVPGLARLSAERVWSECKRLLEAPDPRGALALMAATGVLPAILPEAEWPNPRLDRLAAAGAPADPLLRTAALLRAGADVSALAERLRLSSEERESLARLAAPQPDLAAAPDEAELRRILARREGWPAADVLRAAWLAEARDGAGRGALRARLSATPRPVFPLRGADLLAAGLPPGPELGRRLARARQAWLAGGCDMPREALLALALAPPP
ncbi:MAG: CCA tRNA nucleotidyltransferase [Acetobacteraceae bacterium]|nr:CCA tRNA nucleotidyltransferase [Acetobacteraceae bacterium]